MYLVYEHGTWTQYNRNTLSLMMKYRAMCIIEVIDGESKLLKNKISHGFGRIPKRKSDPYTISQTRLRKIRKEAKQLHGPVAQR